MPFVVHLRDTETGEVRLVGDDDDWDESSEFFWFEGHFGCDCNRSLVYAWSAGEPEREAPVACDGGRYLIDRVTDGYGTVLEDGEELVEELVEETT